MEANGLVPQPAAVRVVACPPYEYLQTAEHNGRPVGFVPKGTLVRKFECAHPLDMFLVIKNVASCTCREAFSWLEAHVSHSHLLKTQPIFWPVPL